MLTMTSTVKKNGEGQISSIQNEKCIAVDRKTILKSPRKSYVPLSIDILENPGF